VLLHPLTPLLRSHSEKERERESRSNLNVFFLGFLGKEDRVQLTDANGSVLVAINRFEQALELFITTRQSRDVEVRRWAANPPVMEMESLEHIPELCSVDGSAPIRIDFIEQSR
jgi:hypothetical protein